jgi:hypothetical protein
VDEAGFFVSRALILKSDNVFVMQIAFLVRIDVDERLRGGPLMRRIPRRNYFFSATRGTSSFRLFRSTNPSDVAMRSAVNRARR